LERQKEALEVTANELSLKLDKLEEFNYIVAHNLRGPASNIQSLTEMALHADNHEERDEYIAMLKRSSDGLSEIFRELSDVLDVSSNPTLANELCNIEEVVEKVLTQFSAEIIFKHAVVTQHFQVKEISYPRIYLESIIYNLVSNGLKYVVDGRQPKIELATFRKEGYTMLTVADNGIGIDMKRHRDQLFKFKKVFHRGYDSRGIGLFLIRHQIERSGGSISAESTPGAGTVFTVTIREPHITP
jgi:signal transduction histidine kinase